tara:strand:+ start:225 stop:656 length:432 start_codon:yes stop_codon:yes gene_type:complete
MNIITEQLANKLPKDSELQKYKIVNPTNFNELYQQLKSNKTNEINVIDLTSTPKEEYGMIISVQDHINRIGTNILTGRQKLLGIDFIDMTNLYKKKKNSIITNCCGEILNNKYEYPSHYICHITTLAHAINIKNIYGFLYNKI